MCCPPKNIAGLSVLPQKWMQANLDHTYKRIYDQSFAVSLTSIQRAVCCLSVSPCSRRIATGEGGKDPCVRVYNRDSEKYTSKLKGHSFEIVSVEWHPSGKFLASCGNVHDRQIIIWDVKKNIQVATSRLNTEPKQMIFYHKNLVTIGKGKFSTKKLFSENKNFSRKFYRKLDGNIHTLVTQFKMSISGQLPVKSD